NQVSVSVASTATAANSSVPEMVRFTAAPPPKARGAPAPRSSDIQAPGHVEHGGGPFAEFGALRLRCVDAGEICALEAQPPEELRVKFHVREVSTEAERKHDEETVAQRGPEPLAPGEEAAKPPARQRRVVPVVSLLVSMEPHERQPQRGKCQ